MGIAPRGHWRRCQGRADLRKLSNSRPRRPGRLRLQRALGAIHRKFAICGYTSGVVRRPRCQPAHCIALDQKLQQQQSRLRLTWMGADCRVTGMERNLVTAASMAPIDPRIRASMISISIATTAKIASRLIKWPHSDLFELRPPTYCQLRAQHAKRSRINNEMPHVALRVLTSRQIAKALIDREYSRPITAGDAYLFRMGTYGGNSFSASAYLSSMLCGLSTFRSYKV